MFKMIKMIIMGVYVWNVSTARNLRNITLEI